MTRLDVLKKQLEMACHNLLCTSENMGMTRPRSGDEKAWGEYKQEVELLEQMIRELEPNSMTVRYFQNVGRYEPLELAVEEVMDIAPDMFILNRMFAKYNADNRPDGKERRSMSMGDVVSIDGRAYCCDSFGWTRL